MPFITPHLQDRCLYITLTIPDHIRCGDEPIPYPVCMPENFDTDTYETQVPGNGKREEFDWGIYWHRSMNDGIWYNLRINPSTDPGATRFLITREEMSTSPRLMFHVAGFIRMLRLDAISDQDVTDYLDWVLPSIAVDAHRSFLWATCGWLKTRFHINHIHDALEMLVLDFDVVGLLWEALQFAYFQVWIGIGGQLPRPILVSDFGVELRDISPDLRQTLMDAYERLERVIETSVGENPGGQFYLGPAF